MLAGAKMAQIPYITEITIVNIIRFF